jgi:hypothetical protein
LSLLAKLSWVNTRNCATTLFGDFEFGIDDGGIEAVNFF